MLSVMPDIDLCLDVAGDQFAPTLRAGDIALVRSRPPFTDEIGVAYDGHGWVLFRPGDGVDRDTVVGAVVAVVRKLRRAAEAVGGP